MLEVSKIQFSWTRVEDRILFLFLFFWKWPLKPNFMYGSVFERYVMRGFEEWESGPI